MCSSTFGLIMFSVATNFRDAPPYAQNIYHSYDFSAEGFPEDTASAATTTNRRTCPTRATTTAAISTRGTPTATATGTAAATGGRANIITAETQTAGAAPGHVR
tara:strand:+ start:82 stop:393 length:312 start_codon:yes stop_codon:yes gene_type:complete